MMVQERRKVIVTETQRNPLDSESPTKGRSNLLGGRAHLDNEAQDQAYLIDLKSLNTVKDQLVGTAKKTFEPAIYNPKDGIKLRHDAESPKKPMRTPRAYSHKQNDSRTDGKIASVNKTRS